jgi:hypothetical protein
MSWYSRRSGAPVDLVRKAPQNSKGLAAMVDPVACRHAEPSHDAYEHFASWRTPEFGHSGVVCRHRAGRRFYLEPGAVVRRRYLASRMLVTVPRKHRSLQ